MLFRYLMMGLLSFAVLAQEIRYPKPLDFQDDALPETFAQTIRQLESDGEAVVVKTENAHLLKINLNGQVLEVFPLPQDGPVHHLSVAAFAMHQNQLAVVNQARRIYLYKGARAFSHFQSQAFSLDDFYNLATTKSFGFNGDQMVVPSQTKNSVAVVLDGAGNVSTQVGKPIAFPSDFPWDTQFLNATFWVAAGEKWYCLFKFKSLLRVYDRKFQLLDEFEFTSEEIANCDLELYEPTQAYLGQMSMPLPHFSDFKIFGSHGYLLCRGALLKLNLNSGKLENSYHFFGRGDDFEKVPEGQRLNMMYLAMVDKNTAILCHPAMLWNHDLWIAKL